MSQRSFLAIDLPEEVKTEILRIQTDCEKTSPGLYKWSTPETLHLTLYFLGNLDEDTLEQVVQRMPALRSCNLELGNIIQLPELHVPKILAVEIAGDIAVLKSQQQKIQDSVFAIADYKETRPFLPHITIGRLKKDVPPSAKPVKRLNQAIRNPKSLRWQTSETVLYLSELSSNGPTYSAHQSFPHQ